MNDLSYIVEARADALEESRRLRDEARVDQPDIPRAPAGRDSLCMAMTCPRCGHGWRLVTEDAGRGIAKWQRRFVVECASSRCRWSGSVAVDLADLGLPRDLPRGRTA